MFFYHSCRCLPKAFGSGNYRGAADPNAAPQIDSFEPSATGPAAMAVPDDGVNLTGDQIDPNQETDRSTALILALVAKVACSPGTGQIRHRIADRLDARLLVIGNDRDIIARLAFGRRRGLLYDLDRAVGTQASAIVRLNSGSRRYQLNIAPCWALPVPNANG